MTTKKQTKCNKDKNGVCENSIIMSDGKENFWQCLKCFNLVPLDYKNKMNNQQKNLLQDQFMDFWDSMKDKVGIGNYSDEITRFLV